MDPCIDVRKFTRKTEQIRMYGGQGAEGWVVVSGAVGGCLGSLMVLNSLRGRVSRD